MRGNKNIRISQRMSSNLLGFETILTFTPSEQKLFMEYYYSSMLTRRELDATFRQFMEDMQIMRLQGAKNYMKTLARERKMQKQYQNNQSHLGTLERGNSKNVFNLNWG